MKNIIKRMWINRKINNGMPIVATVFDLDNKDVKYIDSNKPQPNKKDWNNEHKNHAEWIIMDKMEHDSEDGTGQEMLISTSPCNKCNNRLKEFNFEKIEYLFEKHESNRDLDFKDNDIVKLYNPKSKKEKEYIRKIESHWTIANLTNRKKTLNRKTQQKETI